MRISVKVKPGAKIGPEIRPEGDKNYTAFLRARAHDGEANSALIELLSEFFHVPKTSITIKTGLTARNKIIELPDFKK